MAVPRPLSRPPIKEALVDFRIASDSAIDAGRLQALRDKVSLQYPNIEEQRGFKAEFRIEDGRVSPSAEELGFAGIFCKTADGTRIAQFRPDGFTLNQLAPYSGADALIGEALRLWQLYRDVVTPTSLTRVALRYINGLRLPFKPSDDFAKFLAAAPPMPAETPQDVSNFLTRVVAHDDQDVVIVTQNLGLPTGDEGAPFTLDVDVYRAGDLPLNEDELARIFVRLRELKNQAFFGFLTEQALELYV